MVNKAKTIIIVSILVLFFGSIFIINYDFPKFSLKEDSVKEEKIPQCMDGFDNDGDGLRDFPKDPHCKSETDNREGSNAIFWIIGLVSVSGLVYYLYKNKKPIKDEDVIQKPIDMDLAHKYLISWFLLKYGDNIPKLSYYDKEYDSYYFKPNDNRYIEEVWREKDDSKETGIIEYYCGIQVNIGRFAGFHVMSTSLSKGIDYILGGNITFRKSTWVKSYGEWKKLKSTFNPSSLQSTKDRLTLKALESGDDDELKYVQDKFRNSTTSSSSSNPLEDLDDFEREDIKKILQQQDSSTKKKKKSSSGYTQKINEAINNLGDGE